MGNPQKPSVEGAALAVLVPLPCCKQGGGRVISRGCCVEGGCFCLLCLMCVCVSVSVCVRVCACARCFGVVSFLCCVGACFLDCQGHVACLGLESRV